MRRLTLLAAALVAPVAARAQPLERAVYRVSERDTSLLAPVCARFADGLTGCRRFVPYEGDDGGGVDRLTFTVTKGRTPIGQWDAVAASASEGFDLVRTDLDGDGAREVVFAHHDATSNGLGVAYWTLYVLPEAGTAAPPLSFSTVEYGTDGAFPRVGGRRALLTAEWLGGEEAGRGGGLYFTGRLFRYERGALVPDAAPLRQRRYLNSFQTERGRDHERGAVNPWRWLSRAYRTVPAGRPDPALTGRATDEAPGRIASVADTDSGRVVTFAPEAGPPVASRAVRFGDGPTRRLFPEGYTPAGGAAALNGRRGTLATYPSDYGGDDPPRVVWLDR